MYITHEEYKRFGGVLDKAAFNIYVYDAEQEIRAQTHNRIDRIAKPSETVKRCIARITDIKGKADVSADKISSFSHDGLSKSYTNHASEDYIKAVNDIIYNYLIHETDDDGTPLLYRGIDA